MARILKINEYFNKFAKTEEGLVYRLTEFLRDSYENYENEGDTLGGIARLLNRYDNVIGRTVSPEEVGDVIAELEDGVVSAGGSGDDINYGEWALFIVSKFRDESVTESVASRPLNEAAKMKYPKNIQAGDETQYGVYVGRFGYEDLKAQRDKAAVEEAKARYGKGYVNTNLIKVGGVQYIDIFVCDRERCLTFM